MHWNVKQTFIVVLLLKMRVGILLPLEKVDFCLTLMVMSVPQTDVDARDFWRTILYNYMQTNIWLVS